MLIILPTDTLLIICKNRKSKLSMFNQDTDKKHAKLAAKDQRKDNTNLFCHKSNGNCEKMQNVLISSSMLKKFKEVFETSV